MSEVGIGIIGSGFMGRTYAEMVSKYCQGMRLIGVTGGRRAAELAGDYEVEHVDSIEALVGRDSVDVVFVTTPHHLHKEHAIAAIEAGKHVLIEKPMACSVADCDAIIETCRSAGVRCSIAFSQRYRRCNVKAKEWIDAGRIGRITQIQEFQLVASGLGGLPNWQSDRENLGTLFGHAIHNFDRIRWLTGAEIKTVYGKSADYEHGTEVEGSSMVVMTLGDGAMATLWCSFQLPKPGFDRTSFAARIVGEKGLIDLDAFGELRVSTDDGGWEVVETQPPIDWAGKGFLDAVRLESYVRQCEDFVGSAMAGREPSVTGWDGRQAVAAALGAYEASRTGREVRLA